MFRYSPRPGTPAADMAQVPEAVGAQRLNKLIAVQNAITVEKNEALVGQEFEVLVEGRSPKDPARLQGYTRCFRMVHFPGDAESLTGSLVAVRAERAHQWGLAATLL
jgi:tRNA-2-methylthio-N6-dimethylallyladenosine synthase